MKLTTASTSLALLSGALLLPAPAFGRLSLPLSSKVLHHDDDDDDDGDHRQHNDQMVNTNANTNANANANTNTNANTIVSTAQTQVSLGMSHTCAIDSLKNLKCWGLNRFGQLGDGTAEAVRYTPTLISIGGADGNDNGKGNNSNDEAYPTKIALGAYHTCAIDNLNNLKCWGMGWMGQLGLGTVENKNVPTIISLGDNDGNGNGYGNGDSNGDGDGDGGSIYPVQLALGGFHTCIIDNIDNLKCWGYNIDGQVGDGTDGYYEQDKVTPTLISLCNATYATQIALGGYHTCVIDSLDNIQCWGLNDNGQLGDGTYENKNTPTLISLGGDDDHDDRDATYPTKLFLGAHHSCIIDNLNNLKCWGLNSDGQLGDGTLDNKNMPTTISLGGGDKRFPAQLALGGFHSCSIDDLNNLKCWGSNVEGQLGDGSNDNKHLPTTISLGEDDTTYPIQIVLGFVHTCVVDNFNDIMCWGSNWEGQLGDGTAESKNTPTKISLALPFVVESIKEE